MSIKTHDGTNNNGLFDLLGVAFYAIATLNTARGTTVPTAALAILSQFAKVTATTENADDVQGLGDAILSWQSAGSSLTSQIQTVCQNILTSFVQADPLASTVAPNNLSANLQFLIAQMGGAYGGTTGGDHVSANTPGLSGSPVPGGNAGDLAIVMDTVQADGTTAQNILAESIGFSVASTSPSITPAIVANSPAVDGDRLDFGWPGGSGLSGYGIALSNPANSLLTNGQFETDSIANLPDSWIPVVATPGTSLLVTTACVQTLTINTTYTGGSFVITWNDGTNNHATTPLPYNVDSGTMQTALNAIAPLANVSATQAANVFTITFTGVGGAVAALSTVSFLTGGTGTAVTQATVTAADALSYSGQSMVFAAHSAEATTLYQALPTLQPNTVYFLHFRLLQDGMTTGTAAATVTASITSGIGGSSVTDAQGNSSTAQVTVSGSGAITADQWGSHHMSFRLAPGTSQPAYLKVTTSGLPAGGKVYFDDFALAPGQQLYNGGPFVAAFMGRTPSAVTDSWTYTLTNSFSTSGGGFQTYFNRVFAMADLGLQLPTAGSTLIADSLIT